MRNVVRLSLLALLALLVPVPASTSAAPGHAAPKGSSAEAGRKGDRAGHQLRARRATSKRRYRKRIKSRTPKAPTSEPAPAPAPAPEPAPEPAPIPEAPEPAPAQAPAPEPAPAPAPEPAPAPAPSGKVLFNGDFDAGYKGWYVQSLASRVGLFSNSAFEGTQASRFEVRDGDVEPDTGSERSEVSGPTFNEGEDLYIRDAIRVPATNTYSAPWQIVQQLHEENWGGSPGVAVFLDNKRTLRIGPGDSSRTLWQGQALQSDRWYDLVYRVKLSQSATVGFVEVWLDGVQQTMANGQARIYGRTIQTPETYIKAGIYRSKSSTGTSIVEHDAIVVGTSLGAVTAAG